LLKNANRLDRLKTLTRLVDGPRVGIVTDDLMMRHENTEESDHPEKPQRLRSILKRHTEYGLFDRCVTIKVRIKCYLFKIRFKVAPNVVQRTTSHMCMH